MIKASSIRKAAAHRARIGEVKNIFMFVKHADDEAASHVVVTDYHKGFLTKCAELQVDDAVARELLKLAQEEIKPWGFIGRSVANAASWAGRNWDKRIKPAIGTVAGAALGIPLGPAGMIAGGMIGRRMASTPGMQPVQPGAKAITRNGKILTRDELLKATGQQPNQQPQQQPAQPSQPKLTPIQQQAQDYQNGVNKQIADQQTANKARADEQARLDAEWRAKNPASGMSQQNPALQPLPTTDQAQAGLQLQHGRFWNSVPSSPYRTLSTGRKPVDPTRDGFTQGMRYPRVSRQRIATPMEGVGGDPTVNMDF